ncbi:hypothetical protein [Neptunitalea lumnitzerae]|uniref:Uncharacterized protein n=1 Tax=Neptunitalea lumnitzerae TaxID=2965509 RepID=A0ABQ5ME92_9FLAO|nr:hypothetical protein [Neptunitalea sp. Y10]GLB47694.1 hypothetical protein Y10_00620 [Neptunitalea sp. Y10]
MNANDVYNIATALPDDELKKLYDMIHVKIQPKKQSIPFKRKRKSLPEFTIEDGIRYLIENHF